MDRELWKQVDALLEQALEQPPDQREAFVARAAEGNSVLREEVMSLLTFLLGEKKKTASVAKERLQIILAHERVGRNAGGAPDYLPALQRDLVAVISKYVKIDPTHLKVNVERQDNLEVLEVKIELPEVAR